MNLAQWSVEHPRASKLANNTYLERLPDGDLGVRLHSTVILYQRPNGDVTLHVGQWRTVTTKARLNEYLPRGWRVHQERGIWYLVQGYTSKPTRYVFADGITIHPDDTISGAGPEPTNAHKLRRQARKFARDYMEAFWAGKVPAPSNGDCWGCLMKATDGSTPFGGSDHVLAHMSPEERYFVPSLLVRAVERFPVSKVAEHCLAVAWNPAATATLASEQATTYGLIGGRQLEKSLYRHLLRELGQAS